MSVYKASEVFVTGDCKRAPYTDCQHISTSAVENGTRMYQIEPAMTTTDTICATVTACDADFHNGTEVLAAYEVHPPTVTSDRLCSTCSQCEQGFSVTKCTATSNTECSKVSHLSTGDIAAIVLTCTIVVAVSIAVVAYSTVSSITTSKHLRLVPRSLHGNGFAVARKGCALLTQLRAKLHCSLIYVVFEFCFVLFLCGSAHTSRSDVISCVWMSCLNPF